MVDGAGGHRHSHVGVLERRRVWECLGGLIWVDEVPVAISMSQGARRIIITVMWLRLSVETLVDQVMLTSYDSILHELRCILLVSTRIIIFLSILRSDVASTLSRLEDF